MWSRVVCAYNVIATVDLTVNWIMTACVLMWPGVRDGVEVMMTWGHAIAAGGKKGREREGLVPLCW